MSLGSYAFLGGLLYYLYKRKVKYGDIIVYGILLTVLFKLAIPTENADMMCPEGPHTKDKKLCREGNGKLFRHGKISKKDSISDLTIKLNKLVDDKNTQVYWRRFFIMAIAICLSIHYILFESLPNGNRLLIMMMVCLFILLNFHSFYNFHYTKLFDDRIKAISKRIYSLEKNKVSANNKDRRNQNTKVDSMIA